MCNFLSAIVLKNGDVLHHPMLDSHSDLVTWFNLPDNSECRHFAKVELTPVDYSDVSTWNFRLDEETSPAWWDEVKEGAESRIRDIAERMIVRAGTKRLIVDGCWIFIGNAQGVDIRGGRIIAVRDSASITNVWGSASITNVWGSASITNVRGSASITDVWGSASITNVWGSASITNVWDSASITNDNRSKANE